MGLLLWDREDEDDREDEFAEEHSFIFSFIFISQGKRQLIPCKDCPLKVLQFQLRALYAMFFPS